MKRKIIINIRQIMAHVNVQWIWRVGCKVQFASPAQSSIRAFTALGKKLFFSLSVCALLTPSLLEGRESKKNLVHDSLRWGLGRLQCRPGPVFFHSMFPCGCFCVVFCFGKTDFRFVWWKPHKLMRSKLGMGGLWIAWCSLALYDLYPVLWIIQNG